MPVLTREQILKSEATPVLKPVSVPEWGGEVLIGVLSGKQRDRFEAAYGNDRSRASIRALMASFSIRDEQNRPLFAESDLAALGEMSGVALDRVLKEAFKLNRMNGAGDEDGEEAKVTATPTGLTEPTPAEPTASTPATPTHGDAVQ